MISHRICNNGATKPPATRPADQQATRRTHVELSTACGTLEPRVSGEPKFAARSKMYSASRRSASGTPL